jgi:DNA-binding NarL/FixJ family response regulator
MARVLLLSGDLLFGSRVQGDMVAVGHDVEILGDEKRLSARLAEAQAPRAEVLVADLTDERLNGAAIVESLSGAGELSGLRTLAFYSHVDVAVRERAERAGFDLIVPRSRMAREGSQLVAGLLG